LRLSEDGGFGCVSVVKGYLVRRTQADDGQEELEVLGRGLGQVNVRVTGIDAEGDSNDVIFRTHVPEGRQLAKSIALRDKIEWLRQFCRYMPKVGPIVRRINGVHLEAPFETVPVELQDAVRTVVSDALRFPVERVRCERGV
jgi:hypothetical protein